MASISKNSSGNWRVQLEHHGQREYKTFKSKSLALRWSVQRQAELQRGLLATVDDAQKTFLREIIARYREKVLPHKRNRGYRWSLNLLEDRFGETRPLVYKAKISRTLGTNG